MSKNFNNKLISYITSRPGFNVRGLEGEVKDANEDYPLDTIKKHTQGVGVDEPPSYARPFPEKWVYPLILVMNNYQGVEIDGWSIKAYLDEPVYPYIGQKNGEERFWTESEFLGFIKG